MTKEERLDLIRERQRNDYKHKKVVGVAVRTCSSIMYGWVNDDFETEVDGVWSRTVKRQNGKKFDDRFSEWYQSIWKDH